MAPERGKDHRAHFDVIRDVRENPVWFKPGGPSGVPDVVMFLDGDFLFVFRFEDGVRYRSGFESVTDAVAAWASANVSRYDPETMTFREKP
jgi:hypothetical protein